MILSTLLIAFVTGLTTGGLSCFAVQGGLLTSSIASSAEKTGAHATPKGRPGKRKHAGEAAPNPSAIARPMLLFLAAKLAAYTLLGFVLGWAGMLAFPSPAARGVIQLAVGIFMLGNGLRMLNVHPIFRIFAFEPPRAVTRLIRRKAKGGADWSTPLLLGALTVLIPCGVTQVMMVAAVSSGSPWMGAGVLFAFVLGASPTFFGVTYLAARLSAAFDKYFIRILGTAILLLGLYSLDTGLNLVGSPVSLTRAVSAARLDQIFATPTAQPDIVEYAPAEEQSPPVSEPALQAGLSTPEPAGDPAQVSSDVTINVLNTGYSPRQVYAPADQPVRLNLVTDGVYSCSLAFAIPSLGVQQILPNNGTTTLETPAQPSGTTLPFMCSMGMFTGEIIFQ